MTSVSARDYASRRRRVSDGAEKGAESKNFAAVVQSEYLRTRRGAALTMQLCLQINAVGSQSPCCARGTGRQQLR
jgi:hypothetical protein